jgi:nucleoside-diphosphate-sugar epimerase
MVQNNLDLTFQLIQGIRLYSKRKPRVILFSSIHVYEASQVPTSEESLIGPSSTYGLMKYSQELLLKEAALSGILELVVFRCTHLYGPGAKPFYNSAIATMCHLASSGETLDLYGNGKVPLDLVFVDDAIEYVKRALEMSDLHQIETFNLATGSTVMVETIADQLEEILHRPLEKRLKDTPVKPCQIEVSKLQRRLGKIDFTDLHSGLAACLKPLQNVS